MPSLCVASMVYQKVVRNKQAIILGCITGLVLWMCTPSLNEIGVTDWSSGTVSMGRKHIQRQALSAASVSNSRFRKANSLIATVGCVKKVLIFGDMAEMKSWPELRAIESMLRQGGADGKWRGRTQCPAHNCNISWTLSNDVSLVAGVDAVVLGMLPKAFQTHLPALINLRPTEGQTWIYYSTETPFRVTVWSKTLTLRQLKYHKMMTYRRDSDIFFPFGYYRKFSPSEKKNNAPKNRNYAVGKEDLIVWIASNCGEVTWPRIPFMERLKEVLPVKAYGHCGNLTCLPLRSERCNLIMRKFKFYLALANSECRDYITEKFWANSLGYNIVPVVYGAPREDFERFAPPDSFIHVSDFPSLEALAEYIRFLDQDDALYNTYFEWKKHGVVRQSFPVTQTTMCDIIPHLYNGTEQKVKLIRDSEWYKGCRKPVISTLGFAKERQYALYGSWSPWKLDNGQ